MACCMSVGAAAAAIAAAASMGRLDHHPSSPSSSCKASKATAVNGCVTPGRHDVPPPITSPAEVFRTDLITAMKKPDGDVLTEGEYAVIDDSWKPEWERGVQVPVKPDISMRHLIVKPGVDIQLTKKFSMPGSYIDAPSTCGAGKLYNSSYYDLDNLDAQWLKRLQAMDIKGAKDMDEGKLETYISFLESRCHENMCQAVKSDDGLGVEYDADVMCAVCRELDSEDDNEMVFCDRCNICVHQACYGIRAIPPGKWFCSPCASNVHPSCVLCGQAGGALKPVRLGTRWAHISCALWIPEVKIANVESMEPISNFHSIPQSRWNLLCSICRIRQGACIQCCIPTCTVAFHVECAYQQGLKMKSRLDQTMTDAVRNEAYCPRHVLLGASPANPHTHPTTPQVNQRERRLEAMMVDFHQYARHTELARKYRLVKPLASAIHSFWVMKRRMCDNKAFLSLPDPWQVVAEERLQEFQRDKGQQKEDSEDQSRPMFAEWELEWERFMTLRQDMEKSRNLSYMIVRRERWKRQLLTVKSDVFLKSADLALNSNDSQNISLAVAVVRGLHPRTDIDDHMATSPTSPLPSASLTSRNSQHWMSAIASPAPYPSKAASPPAMKDRVSTPGSDSPAKRLRSAASAPAALAAGSNARTAGSTSSISSSGSTELNTGRNATPVAAKAAPTASPSQSTSSFSKTFSVSAQATPLSAHSTARSQLARNGSLPTSLPSKSSGVATAHSTPDTVHSTPRSQPGSRSAAAALATLPLARRRSSRTRDSSPVPCDVLPPAAVITPLPALAATKRRHSSRR